MWKFVSSYKHMFWYEKDNKTVVIYGDIYRDNFEATMTDEMMEYFENLEGVTVMDAGFDAK